MSALAWVGFVLLLAWTAGSFAAEDADERRPVVRLAMGPLFTPGAERGLEEEAQLLRDFILVRLSAAARFEIVDRDEVRRVCDELQLRVGGMATRDQVARLGARLNCERFVSGSISSLNGRRHVWVRVIGARTGVVLDLQPVVYAPGELAAAADRIAVFVVASGGTAVGRQFAALGPFHDMSPLPDARRDDWSRRLPPLIERHLAAAGVGIVEWEAAGMLFEERRLQETGLAAGPPSPAIELQQAFWLIDGGAGWMEPRAADGAGGSGQPGPLVIGLRVQRVGGPEQRIWLTNAPGAAEPMLEEAIAMSLRAALRNTNRVANAGANAEPDLFAARAREFAFKQSPFWPRAGAVRTRWDQYKQLRQDWLKANERQQAVTATYQRALLQDPNNQEAKQQVAMAYLWEPGGARWSEGVALLQEVAAGGDPVLAPLAAGTLGNLEVIRRAAREGPSMPPRPVDWESIQQAYAEEPDDPEAQFDYALNLVRQAGSDPGSVVRSKTILRKLIAGNDPRFVPKAKELLSRLDRE